MLDSVRYQIPIPEKECEILSKNSKLVYTYNNIDSNIFTREGDKRYRSLYVGHDYYHVSLVIFPKKQVLYLEFSIPKLLIGNNCYEVEKEAILEATGIVYRYLIKECPSCPPFETWSITKLDLPRVIKHDSQRECEEKIKSYQSLKLEGYDLHTYNGTTMWSKKGSCSIKFYDKHKQFMTGDKEYGYKKLIEYGYKKTADRLAINSKGMERFEVSLHYRALLKHFGKRPVISDVLNFDIEGLIDYYMGIVANLEHKDVKTYQRINDVLIEKYGLKKGTRLFEFFYLYFHSEYFMRDIMKKGYSKPTIYRLKRELEECGVFDMIPTIDRFSTDIRDDDVVNNIHRTMPTTKLLSIN